MATYDAWIPLTALDFSKQGTLYPPSGSIQYYLMRGLKIDNTFKYWTVTGSPDWTGAAIAPIVVTDVVLIKNYST